MLSLTSPVRATDAVVSALVQLTTEDEEVHETSGIFRVLPVDLVIQIVGALLRQPAYARSFADAPSSASDFACLVMTGRFFKSIIYSSGKGVRLEAMALSSASVPKIEFRSSVSTALTCANAEWDSSSDGPYFLQLLWQQTSVAHNINALVN